ncbi:MAG: hypothetical protein KatS3mg065_0838 [Chloroflexota bacterium]|nr:MAG: hypothetical protein KatS3mg065_0838 [Chloroflexota bacterium]
MARRPTTAARRYAEAAFDLADRDRTHDAWLAALTAAAEALAVEEVLRIVDNPAVPIRERQAAAEAILAGQAFARLVDAAVERLPKPEVEAEAVRRQVAERVGRQVARLVALLVERRRVDTLPRVAEAFRQLLLARRGIVEAEVVSAAPLTAAEATALRERLEGLVGRSVELRTRVDPGLLGGLMVRIGDRLYDASVRGRLERLRTQLVAAGRGWAAGAAPAGG